LVREIKVIARGAFLHDIGKMAIPDEILRKPGKLTREEEQTFMREHCARGYNMLRKIPFLAARRRSSFATRNTYDGSAIPTACAAARFPSAPVSSPSPTPSTPLPATAPTARRELSTTAREEILRCSGTQFDPAVVEVFLKVPNELWQELRSEISGQNKRFSTFDLT
jgi:response regulator RpfG family c-di-GMP phosphodiesterase